MDLVSLEERRRHDLIPEIISIESLLKYERNELFSNQDSTWPFHETDKPHGWLSQILPPINLFLIHRSWSNHYHDEYLQ
jgi:hypothetical protein